MSYYGFSCLTFWSGAAARIGCAERFLRNPTIMATCHQPRPPFNVIAHTTKRILQIPTANNCLHMGGYSTTTYPSIPRLTVGFNEGFHLCRIAGWGKLKFGGFEQSQHLGNLPCRGRHDWL